MRTGSLGVSGSLLRMSVGALLPGILSCQGQTATKDSPVNPAGASTPALTGPTGNNTPASPASVRFGSAGDAVTPPPALSGGTLIVTRDDRRAVASDPDRDVVWIADIARGALLGSVPLETGDEPGRLVEDGAGRVHVILRHAGAIATIDLGTGSVLERRAICAEPRGIAYDAAARAIHVACLSGQLITVSEAGGEPIRTVQLPDDLRDVVVRGSSLWISRFRSAQILVVDARGDLTRTIDLPTFVDPDRSLQFEADVAYKMAALPSGGVAILHQRAASGVVEIASPTGAYGGGTPCDSKTVHSTVTIVGADGTADDPAPYQSLIVPVDLAISPDGYTAVAAAPGDAIGRQVYAISLDGSDPVGTGSCTDTQSLFGDDPAPKGQITAVAFDGAGNVVVQSREPAALHVTSLPGVSGRNTTIALPARSVADFGHAVFHMDAGGGLACASCHPEGGDDGRTWRFDTVGARRTQSLRTGVGATAPYHWDGSFPTLDAVVGEVFTRRMSGPALEPTEMAHLVRWVSNLPPLARAPASDPAAAARGRDLFMSAAVGCASCHAGARYTNNTSVDVGTGGVFQVPSLTNIGARAPYLHDGCARTLAERFGPCGGDHHGNTAGLTPGQVDDLVAFLKTL